LDLGKFGLEYVNFVQEEDDGCSDKPSRVDHGFKQYQRLPHPILGCRRESEDGAGSDERTYLRLVFEKILIILAEGGAEDDRGYRFKTMNPLFAFRPLTSDVKHVYPGKMTMSRRGAPELRLGTYESWPMLKRVSVMPTLF
jgi:hypothetical protein